MVIGITNLAEKEALKNVAVSIRGGRDRGERSSRPGSIKAKKMVEVGWKELKSWEVQPGDHVTISADGYDKPVEVIVPQG
jgi:hypothetical protein